MFIAQMDSESLSWLAIGETEDEALEALRKRWNERQRKLLQDGWINKPDIVGRISVLEEWYGINVTELKPGECECW